MSAVMMILFASILWGYAGAGGQFLIKHYQWNSESLTAMRLLLSGFFMILIFHRRLKKELLAAGTGTFRPVSFFMFAVFGITLCQFAYYKTIQYSNAGIATVLQYLNPAIILLYGFILHRSLPAKQEWLALLLSIFGTFLLSTHGNIRALVISPYALLWGLVTALATAVFTLYPEQKLRHHSAIFLNSFGMLVGGILLSFPFPASPTVFQNMDLIGYIHFFSIILFGTMLPFTLYIKGVSLIGGAKASLLSCAEPLSAAILCVVWHHEIFLWQDILGLICILLTVIILVPQKLQTT